MRFALEARQTIRIEREDVRQHFERNVAIQFGVASAIDLTHPAATERGQNLVVANRVLPTSDGSRSFGIIAATSRARCDFPRRCVKKISGLIVGGDQPVDLTSERLVFAACRFKERTRSLGARCSAAS